MFLSQHYLQKQRLYPTCRIRDLNDEINKLIREKGHWEVRIVELGGPDYARVRDILYWLIVTGLVCVMWLNAD